MMMIKKNRHIEWTDCQSDSRSLLQIYFFVVLIFLHQRLTHYRN